VEVVADGRLAHLDESHLRVTLQQAPQRIDPPERGAERGAETRNAGELDERPVSVAVDAIGEREADHAVAADNRGLQ
jgi:hypothetical protein